MHTTFSDDDSRPKALVGTNVSGSTATYSFRGELERTGSGDEIEHEKPNITITGTGISVVGALPVTGTFSIHSTHTIDGGAAKELPPADTSTMLTIHLSSSEVDTLRDGEHTLVITNTGQDYWLDYLAVTTTQSVPSPTTTARSTVQATSSLTMLLKAKRPSPSTVQPSPSISDSASTSSAAGRQTTASQSVPGPSSRDTHPFSNAENATLTSTDAAVATPSANPSSTQQSPTSSLTSGTVSPNSTSARAPLTKFPAAAIAGPVVAVAGFLAAIVGIVGYRSGRRKQGRSRLGRHDSLPSNGAFMNQDVSECCPTTTHLQT